jgi:hypothetical protein
VVLDLDRGCTKDVTRGPEAETKGTRFVPSVEGSSGDDGDRALGIGFRV